MRKPQLNLKPSRILRYVYVLLVSVTALVVFFIAIPWWYCMVGAALVLGLARPMWQRHVRLNAAQAVVQCVPLSNQRWNLVFNSGVQIQAMLQDDTILTGYFVLLNFVAPTRKFSVLVLPDSVPTDEFRALRAYLNIHCRTREEAW